MTAAVPVLRIDATGTPFGTAPTYTDRSGYLLSGNEYPVTITFGRQDEQGDPPPAQASFYLKNDDGYWTPGAGVGPAGWDVGAPVNLRLTANAVTYDRFTGFVDAIEPTWPGGVQSWSVVKVTATDVGARFGIAKPLGALFDREVLVDAPTFFYPMQEDTNPANAGDVCGVAPPLVLTNSSLGASTCTFGVSGATFDRNAVQFDSNAYGTATDGPLTVLRARPGRGGPGIVPMSGGFVFEIVTGALTAPAGSGYSMLAGQFSDDTGVLAKIELYDIASAGTGTVYFVVGDAPGSQSYSAGPIIADGQSHHIVGILSSDYKTTTLWVDGVSYGSTVVNATALNLSTLSNIVVGGQLLPNGNSKNGTRGSVAAFAMYGGTLASGRITDHAAAALGTGPVERSDQRFSRIAAYGGITTSGLPTGLAAMGGQKTNGVTAVDALTKVARTEGTVAYVTPAGALTFQGRQARYHAAVGIVLAASDIKDFAPRRDRQGLANQVTVTREGGASQRVVDTTSQTAIGSFDGGSFEVAPSTDEDAYQSAAWQVGNRKTTRTRVPSLTVDMYAQTSTTIVAACLNATISTKVTVSALPVNAPASTMTLFVEGYTERFTADEWEMGFYTSPVGLEDSTLVLDDATFGALDTYRLGF